MNAPAPAPLKETGWLPHAICLALAALTWLVFGQTTHFEFVNYDDNIYVLDNAVVAGGLTPSGIATVFTHVEVNFYHPLTMLSLMANHQLSGLQPGGYHLTNVLFHTLSVMFLFLALRRMTGCTWRSAFVAALFAVHPLRAESVAWVAERKDVLSGFFFMLTLWAYARYVAAARSPGRYGMVLGFFTLGLLCKSSLVTLPFVLLLLDYWPLRRFENRAAAIRLIVEKIPLLVLSLAAALMTVVAEGNAISSTAQLPFLTRVGNPILSYVTYLRQMFWPADLAPFYPYPAAGLAGSQVMLALALLAGVSVVTLVAWRRRPYLLVGWSWYLGMLVPMIGIVQVGQFAHADRFTYLPAIGLGLLLTWLAADLSAGWHHRRVLLGGGSIIVLAALIFCARTQTGYWRNSEALWTHAIACTPPNAVAHGNLGVALAAQSRPDDAIKEYRLAIALDPEVAATYLNLAVALTGQGALDESVQAYQTALAKDPDYAEAHNNLGILLARQGHPDEAMTHFKKAAAIRPDYAEARNNLGILFGSQGRFDEATATFQKAIEIDPRYADAWCNLANVYALQGRTNQALEDYRQALKLNPGSETARAQIQALIPTP